jgi:hypothetical protein
MGRTCSTQGRDEKCIEYFSCKSLVKEPLGRPKHRWEDNMDLRKREAVIAQSV